MNRFVIFSEINKQRHNKTDSGIKYEWNIYQQYNWAPCRPFMSLDNAASLQ